MILPLLHYPRIQILPFEMREAEERLAERERMADKVEAATTERAAGRVDVQMERE